jgi:tRNA (guanine37-N1)-methyltransferase
MKIDIISLFPNMFNGPFDESIISRAKLKGVVDIQIHDLRRWGLGERKTVDDRPYGGGVGMVLLVEPIYQALQELKRPNSRIIAMTAQGSPFKQAKAKELSHESHLIFLCGRYEGFDNRILSHLVDEEISIGDYVLTGGELSAMVVIDAVTRLLPGAIEKSEATKIESFTDPKVLEYPQYTRPEEFNGWKVPKILLSGDHKKITEWREKKAGIITKKRRPDLSRV